MNDTETIGNMCETETIDKLYLELSQFTKAKTKNDILLERLLMAVKTKLPNKTRFETALMFIEQAESSSEGPSLSFKRQ